MALSVSRRDVAESNKSQRCSRASGVRIVDFSSPRAILKSLIACSSSKLPSRFFCVRKWRGTPSPPTRPPTAQAMTGVVFSWRGLCLFVFLISVFLYIHYKSPENTTIL